MNSNCTVDSTSANPDNGNSLALLKETSKCQICGSAANGRHFGALACHACAAFFRRSVANKRTYVCRNQRMCRLVGVPARQMCRFCRVHTCLAAGMSISEVKSSQGSRLSCSNGATTAAVFNSPSDSLCELPFSVHIPDNVLGELLRARRAIFYNRVKHGMFKGKNVAEACASAANIRSMLHTFSTEAPVCLEYLRATRICDFFDRNENAILVQNFLPLWVLMETFRHTAKNGGISIDRIYCLNEEYIELDLNFLEQFYRAEPTLKNPRELAMVEKCSYVCTLEGARTIVKNDLDDYEFAFLVQLTLIHIATNVLPDSVGVRVRLAPYVRALTKALQRHYAENYDETAVRMGNLILLVGEMLQVMKAYNERIILLDMSSMWSSGPGAYSNSPYRIQKAIVSEVVEEPQDETLWLPLVPLELSIDYFT